MIEVENLEKTYGNGSVVTPVLKDISFRIERGEFVAIMGASGTGKSTLLNILGCLDKPTAGHYRIEGVEMANLDDDALSRLRSHKIGFVFQQFHLVPYLSVLENVLSPSLALPGDGAGERAEELIAVAHPEHRDSLRDEARRLYWP